MLYAQQHIPYSFYMAGWKHWLEIYYTRMHHPLHSHSRYESTYHCSGMVRFIFDERHLGKAHKTGYFIRKYKFFVWTPSLIVLREDGCAGNRGCISVIPFTRLLFLLRALSFSEAGVNFQPSHSTTGLDSSHLLGSAKYFIGEQDVLSVLRSNKPSPTHRNYYNKGGKQKLYNTARVRGEMWVCKCICVCTCGGNAETLVNIISHSY